MRSRVFLSIAFFVGSIAVEARASDKECMDAASAGQELRDEGRLLEARTQFQRCAQSECPAPIPGYCADWLNDLTRKLPSLVLRAVDDQEHDVTDATVFLDGREVVLDGRPIEIDPGRHRLRVERPGAKPFEKEVVAAQGEKDRVIVGKLVAEPPPPPEPAAPPPPRRAVPKESWVGWGIGAAGLLSFSIFGTKAQVDYDDYRSSCGQRCSLSDRNSVATSLTVADVSLVLGLLGAGVGTVFYLMQPKVDAKPAVRPNVARGWR